MHDGHPLPCLSIAVTYVPFSPTLHLQPFFSPFQMYAGGDGHRSGHLLQVIPLAGPPAQQISESGGCGQRESPLWEEPS